MTRPLANSPLSQRILAPLAACLLAASLAACSGGTADNAGDGAATKQADPLAGLAITTAKAEAVSEIPLATVPGTISLPPEARVAVTSPYPGAALRVYVIEGQAVSRGQPLALVRAAEPVQIRGELTRAQSEVTLAQARAARLSQLASEGVIAQARADEAQAALQQARASLAEQRRLAAQSGAGSDGSMTLRAPIGGRVSHVGVETGGPVDGMTAPFVIEASGAYRVDLQLPERLARSVRPGMPVSIELDDGAGGRITAAGQILTVAPSIDPESRSVMAKASIGAAPGVVAGRNVMVIVSGRDAAAGVAVPSSAVTRLDGADHVFVRKGKSFEPRKVTVAAEAGGRSMITAGLKPGEVVATSSVAELKAMAAE
ncbi:MAG: efflux RND transporter periplasmic adaptor subunit [Sphingomonadales bacterium]|nr:efflux RND transporter periplasmic adaptor subunit [Sphingomonadales bacterium]MBD3775116.1 efflux RND transporter periplasmic adaptor subunit [Paracoccaceae bacterium]